MKTTKTSSKRTFKHLNQFNRDRIEALLLAGHKQTEVAKVIGVNKATISREIKRNRLEKDGKGFVCGAYKAITAQRKSKQRRLFAKYQSRKIEKDLKLKKYIIHGLKNHLNPDEIAGRMKLEGKTFCTSKTTIYNWLHSSYGQRYCKYLCSKRYDTRKRRKKKKTKRTLIPNRVGIEMRDVIIEDRLVKGHFEADTVVSGKKTRSKVALVVAIDRKTRYTRLTKISNLKPASFNEAILYFKQKINIQSLTLDNGIENTKWEELNIPSYFCDPYSSYQKGSVENVNKMIRKYIPKGCDISKYSDEFINKIETILNNKPRKILGYLTPKEAMEKEDNLTIKKQKTFEEKVAFGG